MPKRSASPPFSSGAIGALAVVDPRPLTRQSLVEMLGRAFPGYGVIALSNCEELLNGAVKADGEPTMIVLNPGSAGACGFWVQNALQWLRLWLPAASAVVLSDGDAPEDVDKLLALGARGYIPTSADPEVTFAAIRLVYAGGTYVPGQLFGARHGAAAPGTPPVRRAEPPAGPELTDRELAVARLVRKGKPNKTIAAELGMQESTVKVHVRNIMRKLHVANRTQAALLAAHLFAGDGEE